MKNARTLGIIAGRSLAISLLSLAAWSSSAQNTNYTLLPIVTIQATDPSASESGDTGTFTILRDGRTNDALRVFCVIGGTALNGTDYVALSNVVIIPAGERAVNLTVAPLQDNLAEGTETVVLTLLPPPPCIGIIPPPRGCYRLGNPFQATVYIRDDDGGTNLPPVVRITSPPNGSFFRTPVNLPIFTYAHDPDGAVVSVEVFEGTNSLGLARRVSIGVTPTNSTIGDLFLLVWSNAPVGSYRLTSKATDNGGASSISDAVGVTILSCTTPPTNRPAIVSIVATDPIAIEGTNCWVRRGPGNRTITNCGPKTASFTVRRLGSTNDSLTVGYAIGGTASNGVDYVALPGVVTIPAGERRALIPVIPIDDGPPDISSTVILRLKPPTTTNVPPDYVLGLPRSAAVLILDSTGPRTRSGFVGGGQSFHLNDTGVDGTWFRVEYSTDMINWTPVCTTQVINGSIDFVDPDAKDSPARFYRAIEEQNPPAE